jgi:hypothetical protein
LVERVKGFVGPMVDRTLCETPRRVW